MIVLNTSRISPFLISLKSLSDTPHSKPALTSLASFFSLNKLLTFPVYITAPSRTSRISELFLISPSITLTPATLPALETEKTSNTSQEPWLSSLVSGASNPDIFL